VARKVTRSAGTGRFVKVSTAKSHPKTTVTQTVGGKAGPTRHRSAVTGHFVKPATAARHPTRTIKEN